MSYADRDKYGMYKGTGGSGSAGPGPALMGADTLLGEDVVNTDNDKLGDIKEIMLDMASGRVAYAVLAFHGFLGMGEKLFAVPWQALHLDTVGKRFVLDVDKDRLKEAPGFNKDSWPDMADMGWANSVHTFYGTDPSRAGGPVVAPGSGNIGNTAGNGTLGDGPVSGSVDPRPGNAGSDTDLSRIRGSNIG